MILNNCRICNSPKFDEVLEVKEMMFGTGKTYKYYKCFGCGVLQIEEPILDPELLYPQSYYSFSSSINSLKNKVKKTILKNNVARELDLPAILPKITKAPETKGVRSLKDYINKNTSILDIGSGSGELLEALYSLGYKNIEGVDPFISKDLQFKGWKIKKGYVTELDESTKYDVIILHHSFEHMADPKEVLQKIKSLLSVNGKCIISIPVCDSYAYEFYKNNWVQLDAPRHVFLHTNKSMNLLAEGTGLKIEKITDDSRTFQFIGSEQYKRGISLTAVDSFYKPFYKKILRKNIFSKKQVKNFLKKAEELNQSGQGDQRVFVLKSNS